MTEGTPRGTLRQRLRALGRTGRGGSVVTSAARAPGSRTDADAAGGPSAPPSRDRGSGPAPNPEPVRDPVTDDSRALPTQADTPVDERGPSLPTGWLELLGVAGSLLSLFTAVLFYFGWASTDAETKALGLRDTVFHLSTSDYLLRSVDALFLPAWLGTAAVFAAIGVHRWGRRGAPGVAWTLRVGRHAWVVPFLLLPLYRLAPDAFDLALPLVTIVGFLLTAYARTRPSDTTGVQAPPVRAQHLRVWCAALLVSVLSLFWAVSTYAGIVGRGRADQTARTVRAGLPAVVVFSEKDLLIRGGGSCDFRVPVKDSAYRYRYAGLRLFHIAGDRVFVVPRDWSPQHGTLYELEQSDSVRIDYVSGGNQRKDECSP